MSEPYDDDRDEASYVDRICDDTCRGVNNCGGHVACSHCGKVVCGYEIDPDNGLCPDCCESHVSCENCGEEFFPEDNAEYKASDGTLLCSQECLDDYESGLESGRIENDTESDKGAEPGNVHGTVNV